MLSDKAKRFHEALHKQIGGADRAAIRASLQRQLPSNIFVQFLAGPPNVRSSLFGSLLRGIAWTTLVVAPVLLLLLMQIQFLPYHSSFITWTHRLALLADLILIWWLWREILSGRAADGRRRPASPAWMTVGFALSLAVVLFSGAVATFPGEWQEASLPSAEIFPKFKASRAPNDGSAPPKEQSFGAWIASRRDWAVKTDKVSLHDWVFNSPVDDASRRRWLPLSSTLVLPGLNIYEGLKIDDPDKVKGRDYVFRARGRDLNGAIFDLSNLPKVDFEGAKLQGASLRSAQLQGVSLDQAELQGALLLDAQLRAASLFKSHLEGAWLEDAHLEGASLDNAHLEGALLNRARLEGASLDFAQLQGAWLSETHLEGASLDQAELQGALLDRAWLQGASLGDAWLQGASLDGAHLEGASLDGAHLEGASLNGAHLEGASLVDAQIQGASLELAVQKATDLSHSRLWRTHREARPTDHLVKPTAVSLPDEPETWWQWRGEVENGVQLSNKKAYQELRDMMEALHRPGPQRNVLLQRNALLYRISSLDCANTDKLLGSCDPSIPPPDEADRWRKSLEDARVDDAAYARALATELKSLVCSGGDDAVYVLRGLLANDRLEAAVSEVPRLVDDIIGADKSTDCPVSASLTEADKASLLQIKRDAIKEAGQ